MDWQKALNMNKFKEKLACLGFSHFLGIGPIKYQLLKNYFQSAEKAYFSSKEELIKILGEKLALKFIDFRQNFSLEKKYQEITNKEIIVLSIEDDDYPESLKNISDPPICLYIKSKLSPKKIFQNQFNFAIVGTRQPTDYGIKLCRLFSAELTKAGFTIISGLAYGIDTIAHQICLLNNGQTIAVLGCGVDIVYPAANKNLYEKIIENGAVISEFPPGQLVQKGLFIARNRIIAGLSKGVMVVEGEKDSGSLITARYAIDQGKEVFAPPAPILSSKSEAPNYLLKQGARLVTSVEDIFEEFNLKIKPNKKNEILSQLNDFEKKIFLKLSEKLLSVEELVLIFQKPINEILNTLAIMEVKGIVKKKETGEYEVLVY